MYSRREALTAVLGGAVVSVAGCSALLGDEIEQSASPARVREQTRQETGYKEQKMMDQTFEQTVEIGGEQRDLKLTNWITEYRKLPGAEEQSAASFLIFTTPTVTIAGQSANPFDRLDEETLIRRLVSRSERDSAGSLNEKQRRETEILGETVSLSVYESTQSVAGQDVVINMYSGDLTHDSDIIYMLGTHPQLVDEAENIYQLAAGIEHPVEP